MNKGFTLLELVIVIVIIGILAAIGVPQYLNAVQSAYRAQAAGSLGEIRRVELIYRGVYGSWDTNIADGINVDVDGDTSSYEVQMSAPPNTSYFGYSYNATAVSIDAAKGTGPANSYRISLNTGNITSY